MPKGVNKAIIIGHLGQDPETRYNENGNCMANISVATSEQWKDRNTGEQQERTEWHRVVFFGKVAEVVGQYLKKGSAVYVEGKIQTRKWQDKEGNDRYTTEIVGRDMQMLGGRPANQSESSGGSTPADSGKGDDFDDPDGIPF